MDLHIDDFYRDTAIALALIYQAFPRKTSLYLDDIVGVLPKDEVGLPHQRQQQCLGALIWLANEGYLHYESTIGYDALDQVVLTEKSFLRLTSTTHPFANDIPNLPASVRRTQGSLIEQIRQSIQNQDTESMIMLVRFFLTQSLAI